MDQVIDINSKNEFVVEDHKFIVNNIRPTAIVTLTYEYIAVTIMRTTYSQVLLKVHCLSSYPSSPAIVELTSPTIPQPFLRQKEKECNSIGQNHLGKPHFRPIYEHLNSLVQSNLLIPCWKELTQIRKLCENRAVLGINEKEGKIQIKIQSRNFFQSIMIHVPNDYPAIGVRIEFIASNFPNQYQKMFLAQAEDIVRKCEAGLTPERALIKSNPIELIKMEVKSDKNVVITSKSVKNLKHDVNVLKQISDLRDTANQGSNGKKYFLEANADRREARKDLRKLAKDEIIADELDTQRQVEDEDDAPISTAQPSLFAVARFLIDDYGVRLPNEVCQSCGKRVFPDDPKADEICNLQSPHRLIRTYCGHWLHYKCLDEWLTTPPFVRQCLICNHRIWHPDWPSDYKQIEKAWHNREERKRELNDVNQLSTSFTLHSVIQCSHDVL